MNTGTNIRQAPTYPGNPRPGHPLGGRPPVFPQYQGARGPVPQWRPSMPLLITSFATISFSLLNTSEFVARVDDGYISKDIMYTLGKFHVTLDNKQKRLIFRIIDHDRLLVRIC